MNANTGTTPGSSKTGQWEPTVLYLILLLVLEWAAFIALSKFI